MASPGIRKCFQHNPLGWVCTSLTNCVIRWQCRYERFIFLSIRRVCVFRSGEWSVKAAAAEDPWLYRTPGDSPTTGSFSSTTPWSTRRYTQEYVLQLLSTDILLQPKELPQHPPGVCYVCLLEGLHVRVVFFNHSGLNSLPAPRKYICRFV